MPLFNADTYMLVQVNQYRFENGLQPLTFNADLTEVALNHTRDILLADTNPLIHTLDVPQAVFDAGYVPGAGVYGFFENHSANAGFLTPVPAGQSPSWAVQQEAIDYAMVSYKLSQDHNANMLNSEHKIAGFSTEYAATAVPPVPQNADLREWLGHSDAWINTQEFGWSGSVQGASVAGVVFINMDGDERYDVGEGRGGIEVKLVENVPGFSVTVYTDYSGYFDLGKVAPGVYSLRVGDSGAYDATIVVDDDTNIWVNDWAYNLGGPGHTEIWQL